MLDLILKRRSVRQYLKKEVEETVLKDILSAGLLAPTGMNKKPCRFYVIKKKEILEALSTETLKAYAGKEVYVRPYFKTKKCASIFKKGSRRNSIKRYPVGRAFSSYRYE